MNLCEDAFEAPFSIFAHSNASLTTEDACACEATATNGGMGAPAKKKWASKKYNKKKKKQQAEKDAAKEARRDADLKHVIINEKRNKRAAKYNVEAVPHPFKSRAHYEASLRNPLGPEWNTTDAHSALVRPKVIIDHGAIIDPIKMSESYKRKLPNLLESSFNTHRKKQRIMRATSRKSKF